MTRQTVSRLLPGLLLCLVTGGLALAISGAGNWTAGRRILDPFTCAIVLGIGVRTFAGLAGHYTAGIRFAAITVLEIAVFLLGFSIDFGVFSGDSLGLVAGVMAFVTCMLIASFTICRAVGLPRELAVLVACGNSICGNAAIAAVAPAVRARNEDVVAAITFSSILGVVVVIALPYLAPGLGFDALQFGTFAGLTVYAVPQVVAATAPVSLVSAQVGTTVKLLRVLMLVPTVLIAPVLLRNREKSRRGAETSARSVLKILPWFIPGFLAAALMNNLGYVPAAAISLTSGLSHGLFVVAMAGLGLSVDLRVVLRIGLRLVAGITCSLGLLVCLSFFLTRALG